MKREERGGNIDLAVLLISAILLCFSAYCWVSNIIQGIDFLFPKTSVVQTNIAQDEDLSETEKDEVSETEFVSQAQEEQVQDENIGISLLHKIDELAARIDNFWYVNVCRKNDWSGLDSTVTYMATGEISSSQVLLGKDGWLFYKSIFDNDPIGDYEGTKQFTQAEKEQIVQGALHVQNQLKEQGVNFTILLCPNKENAYAAYMPEIYVHAEKSRTDMLAESLEKEGIFVINLKDEIIKQSEDYPLYYSYDTHWNQLGGYIGTREVLRAWNIDFPHLEKREIFSQKLLECENRECVDDLSKLSRLQFIFDDEMEHIVIGTFPIDWQDIEKEGYLCFKNPNADCQDRVLLVGDSFRKAMLPSLCEKFKEVYVVHRNYFNAGMLEEIVPDYIIAEYVERYSAEMLNMEHMFLG